MEREIDLLRSRPRARTGQARCSWLGIAEWWSTVLRRRSAPEAEAEADSAGVEGKIERYGGAKLGMDAVSVTAPWSSRAWRVSLLPSE